MKIFDIDSEKYRQSIKVQNAMPTKEVFKIIWQGGIVDMLRESSYVFSVTQLFLNSDT